MGDDVEQGGNGSITNMGLMLLCNNTSTDMYLTSLVQRTHSGLYVT